MKGSSPSPFRHGWKIFALVGLAAMIFSELAFLLFAPETWQEQMGFSATEHWLLPATAVILLVIIMLAIVLIWPRGRAQSADMMSSVLLHAPSVRPISPPDPHSIARDVAYTKMISLLRQGNREAMLTGLSGTGKRTLAMQVAHQLRADYPDQLLIDLSADAAHPHQNTRALRRARMLLAARHQVHLGNIPTTERESSTAYYCLIRDMDMRVLIVLVNPMSLEQLRLFRPPDPSAMVILGNTSFLPPARTVDLDLFTPTEATNLLHHYAPSLSPDHVEQVRVLCHNHPLALRVMASLLATHTNAALVIQHLRDIQQRLKRQGRPDTRCAIESSLGMSSTALDTQTQEVLHHLAVLPTTFDATTVQQLFGKDLPVEESIARLVAAGLVVPDGDDCYRMHTLVRTFVVEQLGEEQRATIERRYVEGVIERVRHIHEQFGMPNAAAQRDALHQFTQHSPHIDVVFSWLRGNSSATMRDAERLLMLIQHMAPIVTQVYSAQECLDWFQAQLDAGRLLGDDDAQIQGLANLGRVMIAMGDGDGGLDSIEQAVEHAQETNRDDIRLQLLGELTDIYLDRSDLELAHECIEEVRVAEEQHGHHATQTLLRLGYVARALRQPDEAHQWLTQALQQARKENDRVALFRATVGMGEIESDRQQHTAAHKRYEDAWSQAQALGIPDLILRARIALGRSWLQQGKHTEAHTHLQEALAQAQQLGQRQLHADILIMLGNLALEQKDYDAAISLYEQSLTIVQSLRDRPRESSTYWNLSQAYRMRRSHGDMQDALKYAERAAELLQSIPSPHIDAETVERHLTELRLRV